MTDSRGVQNAKSGTQISVGTVPGEPTGESATTGVNSVAVTWGNAPGAVSSYTLLVKDAGTVVQTINPAISPVTVTGLTAGKTYTFDVFANNGFGSRPGGGDAGRRRRAGRSQPHQYAGRCDTRDGGDVRLLRVAGQHRSVLARWRGWSMHYKLYGDLLRSRAGRPFLHRHCH